MSDEFQYDVFLSHAKADKPAVRELAERLKGDGLRVWFDEWVIAHQKGAVNMAGKLADIGPGHEPSRLRLRMGHART